MKTIHTMTSFQKVLISFFLIIMFGSETFATGPSYIYAEMRPISINEKGEILCRTRFQANPSGGSYMPDVKYGICVLTDETILQFETHVQIFEGYPDQESYQSHKDFWDSLYESDFDSMKRSEIEYGVFMDYKFTESNISQYKKDNIISLKQFEELKKADMNEASQQAIYRAKGHYINCDSVHILYDFGDIVFTQNKVSMEDAEEDEVSIGAVFDYPNNWGEKDIGYDYYRITGVLFLGKK